MAITTDTTYATGDIVKGRPLKELVPQPVRKGIVLGFFGKDASSGYLVWWYGMGRASMQTVSLMFGRELRRVGVLEDLSLRVITTIARGAAHHDDALPIAYKAGNLSLRRRRFRIQDVPADWSPAHRCCLKCGNAEPQVQLRAITHTGTSQQALTCDRHVDQVGAALG